MSSEFIFGDNSGVSDHSDTDVCPDCVHIWSGQGESDRSHTKRVDLTDKENPTG